MREHSLQTIRRRITLVARLHGCKTLTEQSTRKADPHMTSSALNLAIVNTTHLLKSRHDLDAISRQASAGVLNLVLASFIDLTLSAKHHSWNARGAHFASTHSFLAVVARELDLHADALGERVASLGAIARLALHDVARASRLREVQILGMSEPAQFMSLADGLASVASECRRAAGECQKNDDIVSAHVLTVACATLEKLLFQVESHLLRLEM